MKTRGLFLFAVLACAACSTPADSAGAAGDGIHVVRGSFASGRSPDGNTVILDTRSGLVVFDTGRHVSHVEQILAYVTERGRPVVAVINSHWHLDHVSGNAALRDAFPGAAVYSHGPSLREALAEFLAKGAEANRKRIADGTLAPGQLEDAKRDLATVEAGERLNPTVSLETAGPLSIDGRRVDVHVAKGASAGDIWVYDGGSRTAIVGDLITLPAPFLDTACPKEWSVGLDEVLDQPFVSVVPGHGRVMTRADVTTYRDAFNALVACAEGSSDADSCASAWAAGVASLHDDAEKDGTAARTYARYYVDSVLRAKQTRSDCAP